MSPRRARAANRTCRHGEGRGAAFPLVLFSLNDLTQLAQLAQLVQSGAAQRFKSSNLVVRPMRPHHAEKAAVQKGVGGVEREPPQPRPNAAIDCG
jgi:hypothetical protein